MLPIILIVVLIALALATLPPHVDVIKLKPDPSGRANHHLYPPTGEVFHEVIDPRAYVPKQAPITAESEVDSADDGIGLTPDMAPLMRGFALMKKVELLDMAITQGIEGAETMTKQQLADALLAAIAESRR